MPKTDLNCQIEQIEQIEQGNITPGKPNLIYQTPPDLPNLLDRPSNLTQFVRNHFQHGALFSLYCVTCAKTLKH